jgi:hypothetical protein
MGIKAYGNAKYEWLKSFLELPNGIPSHDTFSRVFARIEPQQFQEGFLSWVNAIVGELELNVIAIDGKTMKQSYDRNDQQKALHIVTAWSPSHQLVLGKKIHKKSNELTAIPELTGLEQNSSPNIAQTCYVCCKSGGVTKRSETQTEQRVDRLMLKKDRRDESYTRPIRIYVT